MLINIYKKKIIALFVVPKRVESTDVRNTLQVHAYPTVMIKK